MFNKNIIKSTEILHLMLNHYNEQGIKSLHTIAPKVEKHLWHVLKTADVLNFIEQCENFL